MGPPTPTLILRGASVMPITVAYRKSLTDLLPKVSQLMLVCTLAVGALRVWLNFAGQTDIIVRRRLCETNVVI